MANLLDETFDGDLGGLKRALSKGADVQYQDRKGMTALMHASSLGYPNIVRVLLDAKADPNLISNESRTAIIYASESGKKNAIPTMQLLINGKGSLDIRNRNESGQTAVMLAFSKGANDIAKYLIEAKSDVNIRDSNGDSLLHQAMNGGKGEFVKLLVKHGANVFHLNRKGQSVESVATSQKCILYIQDNKRKLRRFAFLMGLAPKSGSNSSVYLFFQHPLFDKNLLKIIFLFMESKNTNSTNKNIENKNNLSMTNNSEASRSKISITPPNLPSHHTITNYSIPKRSTSLNSLPMVPQRIPKILPTCISTKSPNSPISPNTTNSPTNVNKECLPQG